MSISVNSFIEWKEDILKRYKSKLENYDTFEKYVNSISLDELEKGINDYNRRRAIYDDVFLCIKEQEEKEVVSLYDDYINNR